MFQLSYKGKGSDIKVFHMAMDIKGPKLVVYEKKKTNIHPSGDKIKLMYIPSTGKKPVFIRLDQLFETPLVSPRYTTLIIFTLIIGFGFAFGLLIVVISLRKLKRYGDKDEAECDEWKQQMDDIGMSISL